MAGRVFQHSLNITRTVRGASVLRSRRLLAGPETHGPQALRDAATYTRRILSLFLFASGLYFLHRCVRQRQGRRADGDMFKRQAERLLRDAANARVGLSLCTCGSSSDSSSQYGRQCGFGVVHGCVPCVYWEVSFTRRC